MLVQYQTIQLDDGEYELSFYACELDPDHDNGFGGGYELSFIDCVNIATGEHVGEEVLNELIAAGTWEQLALEAIDD